MKQPTEFEWDEANIKKNRLKHKVEFKECEEVFLNEPIKIFKDIKHSQKESRYTALGITDRGRKLYLVFTIRNGKIRIVSARDQSRKERRFYETDSEV
jgi:uncharacterized DUF497 family protein